MFNGSVAENISIHMPQATMDQIINAADGYARNFLFPKGLAVPADSTNMSNLKSKEESNAYKKSQ